MNLFPTRGPPCHLLDLSHKKASYVGSVSISGHPILFVALWASRPSEASMYQETRPSLVQIMACRLFDTNPLSEPMLIEGQCVDELLNKQLRFNFRHTPWVRNFKSFPITIVREG